jgi:hypothetical protein
VYNNLVARLPFGSSQSSLGMSTAMRIVAATGLFTLKCLKEEEEIRSLLRWVLHHCLGEQLAVASTANPFFFFSLVSESQ